jgi:hypothetical protein
VKVIDEKGRLFGLLNVLDLLVLVLIIGAAASFAFRASSGEATPILNAGEKFYVTFRTERVREFSVKAVNVGDTIYEQHADVLGKVVKVWTEEPHEIVALNDGTAAYFPMEGKYDLFITIEATGAVNSNGYYVNGNNHLSSGKDVRLQSNMVYTSARVFSVSREMPA